MFGREDNERIGESGVRLGCRNWHSRCTYSGRGRSFVTWNSMNDKVRRG